jgi:hypothetical protein
MAKVWVLDTETKGTGAQMVPLDKVLEKGAPAPKEKATSRQRHRRGLPAETTEPARVRSRKAKGRSEKQLSPLPPGHVRKKATGEIGRIRSVDSKAGTASVLWLRQGRTSTVPLTAISRR